ncbi:helix-turn-helix domain-containing protein [Streptomyces sp. PTM05]|uniref:Helix-turn-helix domain-containing protein n=1 Tax=Streptantibioticus parmotrematis TaxID=2873249 RepID=A0ABS7QUK2_9ACTN|nr:helix-turn-helix domain-containing protein [Streptantibioticus parmotrematis]MBY8886882.1 helix-turn-helix domain-containing protein [Streptantibioticus parmotrematis]
MTSVGVEGDDAWGRVLVEVGRSGRRLRREELDALRAYGDRAAESGRGLAELVDERLAAAGAVWAGQTVDASSMTALRAAVAAIADGHSRAYRERLRREEAGRREFVADLLSSRSDVGRLAEHAERFGINLACSHVVAVAAGDGYDLDDPLVRALERQLLGRFGEQEVLLAVKHGRLVCVVPSGPGEDAAVKAFAELTQGRRVVVGRPHSGPGGVVHSYEEARSALEQADQLGVEGQLLHAADLLVLPVLLRDRDALEDLVRSVLGPLRNARGGAGPLLETLTAYADSRYVSAEAARRLGLSVRALAYRVERVVRLTGLDPDDALQRYTLETAVFGARLLGWLDHAPPPA